TAVFVEFAPAQERTGYVIEDVQALVDDGTLNSGQGNALITKLQHAIERLNAGNETAAMNQLNAFVNQVHDFVAIGVLTEAQAMPLLEQVASILWQIENT